VTTQADPQSTQDASLLPASGFCLRYKSSRWLCSSELSFSLSHHPSCLPSLIYSYHIVHFSRVNLSFSQPSHHPPSDLHGQLPHTASLPIRINSYKDFTNQRRYLQAPSRLTRLLQCLLAPTRTARPTPRTRPPTPLALPLLAPQPRVSQQSVPALHTL
jgi:hypothetical protein